MTHTSFEVNGKRLFYTLSRGLEDGPRLVLVHGAGGSRLHWPPELRRLPDATVYALDLPGHGRSEGSGYDAIEDYAEAVAGLLRVARIERAVVVGHSMGGAIAQTLALDAAHRVAAIVLVATGARLRVSSAILDGIRDDFEAAVDLITRFAWSAEADPALIELGRQALVETGPNVLWADFAACDRFDVMGRLESIELPTLVVVGTADQLTPVKYGRFLADHVRDARCVTVDEAGHMVMLERPQKVAEEIREFLVGLR